MCHNKLKRSIIILMIVMMGAGLFAFEKVGVTSFQFLKVTPDARSAAMGGATSSMNMGIYSIYSNPANLVDVEGWSGDVSYVDYFFDVQHQSLALSWTRKGISLGLVVLRADYGDIEETTVEALGYLSNGEFNPGLTGNVFRPGAQVYGLSFAQRLTDKFSYGIVAKYAFENMVYVNKGALMFDVGLLYDTKFKSLRLSAAIRNFGSQIQYYDYSYPLPQTMVIGLSGNIIGREALLSISQQHRLTMAFELVQPRDYDQQYHIGMEYALNEILFVRSGYKINYDSQGLTLGMGLKWKGINFDYSFSSYKNLPAVSRFSLGYNLSK